MLHLDRVQPAAETERKNTGRRDRSPFPSEDLEQNRDQTELLPPRRVLLHRLFRLKTHVVSITLSIQEDLHQPPEHKQ